MLIGGYNGLDLPDPNTQLHPTAAAYRDITEKYIALGFEVSHDYKGPPVLKYENVHKVDEADFHRLSQCHKELSGD